MARILPLQADAISQIHSSKHITSIQDVVLALLENSLDAGSNKVGITVDFRRGGCSVDDNGSGIASAEFMADGGLGKMYHTSKHRSTVAEPLHGTSGTYLASLAALSLLSISSCKSEEEGNATLTMHQGKIIARQVAPVEETSYSTAQGTRVIVKDLFGNVPVRVKHRALTMDDSSKEDRTWHELKRSVVALLLAWHRPCSVKMRDVEAERKTVQLSAQHPAVSNALTERSLNNLGAWTKFDLRDALPVLVQAGLVPAEVRTTWIPISASSPKVSIKGAINLQPAPTKRCQFISIGIHPCRSDVAQGDLYDIVNKVFVNSSFGSVEDAGTPLDEVEKDRRKRDRRYKNDEYTQKQLHGRKGVDKWPMLVIQVNFNDKQQPRMNAENVNDGNVKAISDILEATVTQWLEAHHFRSRKRGRRKNQDQTGAAAPSSSPQVFDARSKSTFDEKASLSTPGLKRTRTTESASTSKKRRYVDIEGNTRRLNQERPASVPMPTTDFNSWSRIKSGKRNFYDQLWEKKRPPVSPGNTAGLTKTTFKPRFNLPPLDVGALSEPRKQSRDAKHSTPQSTTRRPPRPATEPWSSSDDYGSIDTEDLAVAVKLAERNLGAEGMANKSSAALHGSHQDDHEARADDSIEWTDPATKQVFRVNARTGVVLPTRPASRSNDTPRPPVHQPPTRRSAAINTFLTSVGQPLSLARRPRTATANTETSWLPGFLKEWDNPVFARQNEEAIPVASIDGPGLDAAELVDKRCNHHDHAKAFSEVGAGGTAQLTKSALRNARAVRQVDRKFILCRTSAGKPGSENDLLVLVDQHAASERVILERLLADICSSDRTTALLDKPIRFEVSAAEHQLLAQQTKRFADWGISYDLVRRQNEMTASQVRPPKEEHLLTVKSLPPAIAERCAQFPNLIVDLLRTEIWSPTTSMTKPSAPQAESEGEERPWLHRIGSCPKPLIDMLNSRACRSAIMFNDELSVAECEQLLADLSKCAFPFMCAHGRVSMVPLVKVGGIADGRGLFAQGEEERGFGGAFKKWRKDSGEQD
ncbi:DNA mismatch repair protein [Saxophila tyrrhenica]|uniref:DNA mismatch repair protein n=1 Tax=Saxophila tyrrhenica TaxID=1690608 RepID=A0AAV9PF35_9PEZI|nr:DNA mismatch repair protein [Saxophila tyrrhenica]